MCKQNLNAEMGKLKAQISSCTGQGLKVMAWNGHTCAYTYARLSSFLLIFVTATCYSFKLLIFSDFHIFSYILLFMIGIAHVFCENPNRTHT